VKLSAPRNENPLRALLFGCFACVCVVLVSGSCCLADVGIDIRSDGVLIDGDDIPYVAAIADGSELISISISAGETAQTFSPSETQPIVGSPTGCQLRFSGAGVGRFNPQITLKFRDGSTQTHGEVFQIENTAPELTFEGVGLALADGGQHVVVSARAHDDVDIRYVAFSVTGLRASDLRAAGGVVAQARERAFATTNGFQRVYPVGDDQEIFTLSVPVTTELDASAIAHDGVVLVDVVAADASSNQASLSRISFTGDDVVEEASHLEVQPSRVIFTNLLETATLIPSVAFQFRGLTPLPGPGNGIAYESSHPDLIGVTAGGTVYPLAETNGANIPDYVTFCTDCHNSSSDIWSTQLGRYLHKFDWATEKHGRGAATDDDYEDFYWYGGPYLDSQAGSYVMSCMDCHEAHGSSNSYLARATVNGAAADLTRGDVNPWGDW
jgi:hypothetical protein